MKNKKLKIVGNTLFVFRAKNVQTGRIDTDPITTLTTTTHVFQK